MLQASSGKPTPAVLAIGLVSVDHYIRVPRLPDADEKVNGVRLGWFAGGMSANFALAARQFCETSHLIATFSHDPDTVAIRKSLESRQVDTGASLVLSDTSSLSSLTLIDDSATKITVVIKTDLPLPEAKYCSSQVAAGTWDLVYLVALDAAWCREIGEVAYRAGAMVVYDLEPFFVDDVWGTTAFAAMMAHTHLVFLKMDSARAMGFTEAAHVAKVLHGMGPRGVVVTDGPEDIYCSVDGTRLVASPPKVSVVDPTGAGDAFAGAFSSLYARRRPVAECLAKATAIGALTVSGMGCQTYAPVHPDVLDDMVGRVRVARAP